MKCDFDPGQRSWLPVLCVLALLLGAVSLPRSAAASCDNIPQGIANYRTALGSTNRPFAQPGDEIQISVDTAGCDSESGGLAEELLAQSSFDADLEGWTVTEGNALWGSNSLQAITYGPNESLAVAPVLFHGDWSNTTELRWQHFGEYGWGGPLPGGDVAIARISGPGGSAEFIGDPDDFPGAHTHVAPLEVSSWQVTGGNWAALVSNVTSLELWGAPDPSFGAHFLYWIDEVTVDVSGQIATVVLYTPPLGPATALVLTDTSTCTALAGGALTQCASDLGAGGQAFCQDTAPGVAGDTLTLAFPNTDDLLAPAADQLGFTGPSRIVVASIGTDASGFDLPCDLGSTSCKGCLADPIGCPDAGRLRACVDDFFEDDDTCGTEAVQRHTLFGSFTALPEENLYSEMCQLTGEIPEPCTAAEPDLRGAVDADGNLVFPMNYTSVELPGPLPNPRFVSLRTSIDAFDGGGEPISAPSEAFFDSFSTRGNLLPPFFNGITDPVAPTDAAFLGTVDAARDVIRFLRRSPGFTECRDDGTDEVLDPGVPCVDDAGCPAGAGCGIAVCYAAGVATASQCTSDAQCLGGQECGPSLFDFSTRLSVSDQGPVLLPGSEYEALALEPVPFDCLEQGNG
ncbi:MAG: hypothetical protein ACR2PQ_00910, partial [Myxococcota bacterium]